MRLRHRKNHWLVLLKLLGVAAMIAVGAAIAIPTLLGFEFPLWHAIAITAGGMVVYTGISFFLRPEANTDNLGWGGGMANDPFQSSDNVNRFLWKLHCALGPGRFTAATLLDLCALVSLAKEEEVVLDETAGQLASFGPARVNGKRGPALRRVAADCAARSEPLRALVGQLGDREIQRDSQRFYIPRRPRPRRASCQLATYHRSGFCHASFSSGVADRRARGCWVIVSQGPHDF
jgi:hypothetical protein